MEKFKDLNVPIEDEDVPLRKALQHIVDKHMNDSSCENINCPSGGCTNCLAYGGSKHRNALKEYLKEGEEFKVGDRVECIESDRGVEKGTTYIVTSTHKGGTGLPCIKIDGEGLEYTGFLCKNFKLSNQSTKTTNKEETMDKNIAEVYGEDKAKDANLVQKHFGSGNNQGFIHGLTMKMFKKEILAEAKNLDRELEKVKEK